MANRMERLVRLGKKGLTAAPFSKTNPDFNKSGETASSMTVDIIEPIASTSKDLAEVSISHLNSNTSDNINVQEIDAICEGTKEDDQSVVPQKRKRSISSSSSDSSSSSSSSSSKFLISGHSQNEGDNAHSLIEKSIKRAKKSGPIYVPDQYVNLIRDAKKRGNPFIVHEMHFSNFYDLKALTEEQAINYQKDTNGDIIKLTELTMIKFTKNSDFYEFKTSFEGEWIQAKLKLVRRQRKQPSQINLKAAYDSKMNISDSKKNDLLQLLRSNIVPSYYEGFYNNL